MLCYPHGGEFGEYVYLQAGIELGTVSAVQEVRLTDPDPEHGGTVVSAAPAQT